MSVQAPAPRRSKKEKPPKTLKGELMSWTLSLVFTFAALIAVATWVGQPVRVQGGSMENTLQSGEYVWVSHLDRDYQRGDIVICHYPNRTEGEYTFGSAFTVTHRTIFIKRLAALPGDTVEIREGALYVNGEAVPDPEHMGSRPRDWGPRTLGEDEYFVIGDNRLTSHDSRSDDVGPLSGAMLQGKVKCVLWPLNAIRVPD